MKVYELLTRDSNKPHWHSTGLYLKEEDAEQAWSDISALSMPMENVHEQERYHWYDITEHKIERRNVHESLEFNVNVGYDVTPEQETEFLKDIKTFFNNKGINLSYHWTDKNTESKGRAIYTFKSCREGS